MIVIKSWTEKHGATIAVNSTAGRGTEFTIALPVKANLIRSSQSFLQASVIPFGLTASS
ncbi:hypothetical protein QUA30_00630 [Microcoleus sp. Pol14C2]|uniref:hypothetical protein n=1 Tax=unclassified Microcoleus TaxID=2642155 RepID=UPI002FCF2DDB